MALFPAAGIIGHFFPGLLTTFPAHQELKEGLVRQEGPSPLDRGTAVHLVMILDLSSAIQIGCISSSSEW